LLLQNKNKNKNLNPTLKLERPICYWGFNHHLKTQLSQLHQNEKKKTPMNPNPKLWLPI
jgi:hypothetical protein